MNSIVQIHSSGSEFTGLIVYALFLFIFFVLAVGFIFIAKYKIIWKRREGFYYAICLIALFLMMGARLLPSFFEFNLIAIQEDGTWIFKNGLGIKLGEISKKNPRKVDITARKVTWYGKSYESSEMASLFISSDQKKFYSTLDLFNPIKKVAEQLEQKQQAQAIPSSKTEVDSRWKILRTIKIGTMLLFVFSLLSPLILFKSKKNLNG